MAGGSGGRPRYETRVTGVGELAGEFFDAGIVVLFGRDAPEEVAEISVLHEPSVTDEGVEVGCTVRIGEEALRVLAVGDVANENLVNLGHLVLKRNGQREASMPGDVCCDEGDVPPIQRGTLIRVDDG